MALRANITGGVNGLLEADVVDGQDGYYKPRGLVTYQAPYFVETNRQTYATNETYGNQLAINGAVTGATDAIHDGTDTTIWTATNLSGTNFIFDSTTVAKTGTKSIDATNTVDSDVALFTRSAPATLATYSSLTGSIYLVDWSLSGSKIVNVSFRLGGVSISGSVDIGQYINVEVIGSWQNFVIPFSAFGITGATVDEMTVTTVDVGPGKAPSYYLDDMKLSAGAGTIYTVAPTTSDVLRVYGFSWTIVDALTIPLVNGTTTGLSYNKFGGLTALPNGILTRRIQFNVTGFSNSTKTHADIISGSNAELKAAWDDGTNTYLKFYTKFSAPVDLTPDGNDRYEFVVQDDLSGLISLTVRADAAVLTQPNGDTL